MAIPGEPKMTRDEIFTEVRWMLSFDVAPEIIARELHMEVGNLCRLAYRHKQYDIGSAFSPADGLVRRGRKAA